MQFPNLYGNGALHITVCRGISYSSLLGRILTKLKVEEVSDTLVIAPWWPTAHWYPPLLQLLVQRPILLPQWDELLTLP